MMSARIGGSGLLEDAYLHNASSKRLKSSSGVQDVLLTSNLVLPAMIFSA